MPRHQPQSRVSALLHAAWGAIVTVWDWAARVDDYRGRLEMLAGITLLAISAAVFLLVAFGVLGAISFVLGLSALVLAVVLLINFYFHERDLKRSRAGSPSPTDAPGAEPAPASSPAEEADQLVARGQKLRREVLRITSQPAGVVGRPGWQFGDGQMRVQTWLDDVDALTRRVDPASSHAFPAVTSPETALRALDEAFGALRRVQVVVRTPSPASDRVALLRDQYDRGVALEGRVVWPPDGIPVDADQSAAQAQRARDEVCAWAKDVWLVLRQHFQGRESEFFAPEGWARDPSLFAMACADELTRFGGDPYEFWKAKMFVVADLIERYEQIPNS
jgi:uncharacterized membrane protein